MTWERLLLAHWAVQPTAVRGLIPRGLELEMFDGAAWIGVVPFEMSGVRLWGMPPVPTANRFLELNVRTYVSDGERRGVWFFSLDAASALASWGGRVGFGLNYRWARMSCERRGEEIEYESSRRSEPAAELRVRYGPRGEAFGAAAGTREDFLTNRLWLFASHPRRGLLRARVWHEPWTLRRAEARFELNTMTAPLGIDLPGTPPHLLYSERLDVWSGPPERCG
jgi:uncharacterized protein YqjF (DUF2071 family)